MECDHFQRMHYLVILVDWSKFKSSSKNRSIIDGEEAEFEKAMMDLLTEDHEDYTDFENEEVEEDLAEEYIADDSGDDYVKRNGGVSDI